ncbi:beta-lactamase hydrolase-like protein [Candidatus Nitrosoglobus terrae]|uniref:Beta-lactamase hydrolase-like protein n=1 Tax=Candidatus Nitrosoglobus terrae TaxID=1630141 RepID=A0A1Q2SNM6_9GAMM|nr:MBL fold metallo-hydrolase [Candidatus Nitrosoglobus terrae]BAW80730.1 beta-lactamase hydrolase-like protein [Candidatus Nitrosoglobus terrae]
MKFEILPVTKFMQNCTLLICEETGRAAVVDPGGDVGKILSKVESNGIQIEKVLLTHGHIDHAGGAYKLARQLGVPIEGPQIEDKFWLDLLPFQSEMFSFPPAESFTPDRWLEQGSTVSFGHVILDVYHCPGHTPGHVVFFHPDSSLALVGDVLFKGAIGRTDFPRGDYDTLVQSIRERLFPLGDEVQFIPGHGSMSTFEEEQRSNPFVGKNI